MKIFNHEEVSKIAIDIPKHQQLMVYYDDQDFEAIKTVLVEMDFEIAPLSNDPRQRRLIYINTVDKKAFVANALGMMCGASSGAQVLDKKRLFELIKWYNKAIKL